MVVVDLGGDRGRLVGAAATRTAPGDPAVLQAVSAVGQHRLMRSWQDGLAAHGLLAGQVLLAPLDFVHRQQYLHARATLSHLLELGVVPVVNENDAVADEEIRFGDNDRLAALVAHLVGADLLVLLTDTPGLLTADPRLVAEASLIEEVIEIDHALEALAGGPGSRGGQRRHGLQARGGQDRDLVGRRGGHRRRRRGPMCSTPWSSATPGAGTVFRPRARRLAARKLWIAFAMRSSGALRGGRGRAARAGRAAARSLLAPASSGSGDVRPRRRRRDHGPRRRGLRQGARPCACLGARREWVGRRTEQLPSDLPKEVVHRDDLVVLT